jgi:hypothetical protein
MSGIRHIRGIRYPGNSAYVGGIPAQSSALVWLDGTLSGSEFVDKSGNGRNFTITNKDFTANYLPYKSAATISAPTSDATLIAADVNNFLYDTGGTPNQIPVVSFFQNIDYEDIGFSRHVAQTLNGNGVETREPHVKDFVWYAAALTGSDLTAANSYYGVPTKATSNVKWVAKDGNNGNPGTEASPYLTIDYAHDNATAGDTVYVKSGDYDEAVTIAKNITIKGIGFSTQIRTTYCYLTDPGVTSFTLEGMMLQSDVGTYNVFIQDPIALVTLNKCHLTNTTNSQPVILKSSLDGNNLLLNDCVINKGLISYQETATINGCLFNEYASTCMNIYAITTFNHCNFGQAENVNGGCIALQANTTANIVDCDWLRNITWNTAQAWNYTLNISYSRGVSDGAAPTVISNSNHTGATSISVTYCEFDFNAVAGEGIQLTGGDGSGSYVFNYNTLNDLNGTVQFTGIVVNQTVECKYNTLTSIPGRGPSIFAGSIEADIQENILTSEASQIRVYADNGYVAPCVVKKNIIISNGDTPAGAFIHCGIEGDASSYGNSNGSVISENSCFGPRVYGNDVGAQHGLFVYAQDVELKYNRVTGTFLAIVFKAAGTSVATKSHHNLIIDCNTGWVIKGIQDAIVYNDTVVITDNVPDSVGIGLAHEYDNLYPGSFSTGLLFKNNIFADLRTDTDNQVLNSTSDDMVDSEFDYNIYYKANPTAVEFAHYPGPGNTTFEDWKTATSQDANSSQVDPEFTDADSGDYSITSESNAAGAGETLAATYDDGLDASTDWGNASTLPVVVTKQQTAPWDVGAYVS